jgi:hypothetical protein
MSFGGVWTSGKCTYSVGVPVIVGLKRTISLRVSCYMTIPEGLCLTDFEQEIANSISVNVALRYRVRPLRFAAQLKPVIH